MENCADQTPTIATQRKRIALISHRTKRIIPYSSAVWTFCDWGASDLTEICIAATDVDGMDRSSRAVEALAQSGIGAPATAIYVIQVEGMPVTKIGMAVDPIARLSGHQCSNWNRLHLKALFWILDETPQQVETAALRAAKEMDCHLRGEWLAMDSFEATALIGKAAKFCKSKVATPAMFAADLAGRARAIAA